MKRTFKIAAALLLQILMIGSTFANPKDTAAAAKQPPHWRDSSIQIAVSTSLLKQNANIKYGSDVEGAVKRSFATWQKYLGIQLVETMSAKRSISPAGARGDGVNLITAAQTNESSLLFAGELQNSAAATRLFYDKSGSIIEADITLNPFQQFSTDGTDGTFDLESTLTHEIGHLLGLDHSADLGATMHEKYGMNGAYGFPSFVARTLSQDDISGLQRMYGAADGASCCQRISGNLISSDAKPRTWEVWAEDTQTGQVRAVASADEEGNFNFGGLSKGSVKLYAQDKSGEVVTKGDLGTVTATSDSTSITKNVRTSKSDFRLDYIGFNNQLSDIAVLMNPGKIYQLSLGGTNLDPTEVKIGFTSPYLTVVPQTMTPVDFGSDVSVLTFNVNVDPQTPPGDYTVYVAGADGVKRFIVGGITVENFKNPHYLFSLTAE